MKNENKKAETEAGNEDNVVGMFSSLFKTISSGDNMVWAKQAWALFSLHKLDVRSLEWGVGVNREKGENGDGEFTKVKGAKCVGVSVSEMRGLIRVAAVCLSLIRKFARLVTGAQDLTTT